MFRSGSRRSHGQQDMDTAAQVLTLAQQTAARSEGIKIAEAAAQERIQSLVATNEALQVTTTEKVAEAEQQKNAALSQVEHLKANLEGTVAQRAQEIREAMEKDKTETVNAVKSQHFQETLKLKARS